MACAHTVRAALAALLLAPACSSPEVTPPQGSSAFDQAAAWAHLERIVGFGPRYSGSVNNATLRGYLDAQLAQLGLAVQLEPFTDTTPFGDVAFENVFADLPANSPTAGDDAPWIVIGTHFDTKPIVPEGGGEITFVGANDGGSGTAVLLELARVIVADERPREVGIRFLFLDGEEAFRFDWEGDDNTYGSRHHAQGLLKRGETSRFGACVILDMVGDKDLGIFHETYSRRELMELFEAAAVRAGLGSKMLTRRWLPVKDDHQSFLRVGIPAVDLIDFEYGPNNAYWHTAEDTLDKCSAASLGAVGRIVLEGLPDLEQWVLDQR